MTVSRRQALAAGAAAVPAVALTAVAQPPAGTRAGGQTATQMGVDPFLAACMLLGGKRQIEVCQFAQTKITDAEVKQFAQAEIDEHETLKADLAKMGYQPPAPTAGAAARGAADARGAEGRGAADALAGGQAVSVGRHTFTPGVSAVLTIDQEVHETCIANTKAQLTKCEQKGKTKFDKGFVGDQLHAHMGLLDKVTTFMKHASPEMQPGLQKALGIIQTHIATCEKLMEKLEQQAMREMQGGQRGSGTGSGSRQ